MPERKEGHKPDDYLHLEDMAMKTAAQFFGEEMLRYLGIHEKPLRVAPTEVVHLEARQMYEDFNYEMENGEWYHFEFESDGILAADLRRFREYEAATSRVYGVPVTTFVVCSAGVREPLSELKEGINTYRVRVVMLKKQDADLMFQMLSRKSEAEIRKQDLLPVLMSPLMSGEMPQKERILRGVGYLRENYTGVGEEELNKMQAVLYALAVKFLNETELKEIKEAMVMTKLGQMLVDDGIEMGIEKGIEKGTERMRKLTKILLDKKRYEELEKAAGDSEYCEQLMERYKI